MNNLLWLLRILMGLSVGLFSVTAMAQTILVLGDSISAGYGMEVQQSWVSLMRNKLDASSPGSQLVNASISGETSAGGLARIDQALQQYQPSVLILELGANDGLRGLSPEKMKRNLSEIIGRAQSNHVKVLLLSMRIPPNYGPRYVEMFYNVYPQLADELQVLYVPFILDEVALDKSLMQRDGLHPNADAQPKISEKIWPYLQSLLAESQVK